jgi:release factor glutamine methyltransferase
VPKHLYVDTIPKEIRNGLKSEDLLRESDGQVRCVVRFAPVGAHIYLTSAFDRSLPYFTYLSQDSLIFSQLVEQAHEGRSGGDILDLCCGVGFVGLELLKPGSTLTGIDINPSAVAMAKINASLHGQPHAAFAIDIPQEEQWDMVTCNPPFMLLPRTDQDQIDSYGGGTFGLERTLHFLRQFPSLIKPGGRGYMITRTPVIDNEEYLFQLLQKGHLPLRGSSTTLCHSDCDLAAEETALGIQEYHHVFLNCSPAEDGEANWEQRRVSGKERFRHFF